MKLRLMICAAAASTALFATDVNSATYAVMNVTNAYTDTVIAVPWVGLDGSAITISNLVNTTTLSVGDKLFMYGADGKWYECSKNADGQWEGSITVSDASMLTAASQTVNRGTGLVLQRAASGAGGTVLLAGRVTDAVAQTTFVANGKTLFANPTASDAALNTALKTGATYGDTISIPLNNGSTLQYVFNGTEWGRTNQVAQTVTINGRDRTRYTKEWVSGGTIPAGTGAWYESKASDDRTINW